MRQNPNSRRARGRGNRKPGSSRSQVFDSNGPGARVRGNSSQIYEKYQQLARDASSSGDRIAAENFYQHAEHYYRLMEAAGLNRTGNSQEDSQQRSEGAAKNGEPVDVATAVADPAAGEPAAESVAVMIEPTEAKQPEAPAQTPPVATNGSGNSEDEVKPVRRTRSRRPNGSANGKSASDKDADAAASEEGSEKQSDDTEPVTA
jgi:hypothetical protein